MILNIPTYWMNSPNFGDALTPYLVEKISGYPAIWTQDHLAPKYMVTGSVLNEPVAETCIVWGAGIAHRDTYIRKPLEIKSVRGPLTRDAVLRSGIQCPEVYGDPALLLPSFYHPKTPGQRYAMGVLPHIVDYNTVRERYWRNPDVLVIDLMVDIEHVIDQIMRCDKLISSSLHGIIAANAYGKDCGWVRFSGKIIGDGTKFRDYFLSVGRENEPGPLNLEETNPSVEDILKWIPDNSKINIDLGKLYDACPFKPS